MRVISTDDITLKSANGRYGRPYEINSVGLPDNFLDSWKKQKAPTPHDLIASYERIAFTCANMNVSGVLNAKLRLYTNKKRGRKTASIDYTKRHKLVSNPRLKLHMASQADIDEVMDHPFLDLWYNPNEWHDSCDFLGYYQLYQEVVGTTYIKLVPNKLGQIQDWWILPSQHVKPVRDGKTNAVVGFDFDGVKYSMTPNGSQPYIKAFPRLNPADPYGGIGLSPLTASFESINLDQKMMATSAAILDNQGRPSGILSPKEPIGDSEARRWEHRFNAKFQRAGSGDVMVSEEDVTFTPLTFPPSDLASLQVAQATKAEVALAFGIPVALLESNQFNRATLEASILQHVRQAIWPRLRDIEGKLNKHIVSLYGDDLFVAFDDPSPESKDLQAAYLRQLVDGGIITPNEARLELDYKAKPEGEDLRGLPGSFAVDGNGSGSSSEESEEDEDSEGFQEGETNADVTPETTSQDHQASELLGRVGGITGMLDLFNQRKEGTIGDETLTELLVLFYRIERSEAERIVGTLPSKEEMPEPQPSPIVLPGQEAPAMGEQDEVVEEDDKQKSLVILDHTGTPIKKNVDTRWKEPPVSPELEKVVSKYFEKYQASALEQIKKDLNTNIVRKEFVPLARARDELVKDSRPFIEIMVNRGAKTLLQRVGLDTDIFSVTNPNTRKAIDKAAFEFAESTNQSTTQKLNDAIEAIRAELGEGLSTGERLAKISKRINEIFDGLTKNHAHLIAQTESSRAHHEGLREAAKQSGVVKGFELLLSPDACDVCQGVEKNNKRIDLDGYFVYGEGTYGNRLVPIHPNCRCTMLEILDIG